MLQTPTQLRKAAILIASVDHRTADALLAQMPADAAATVRRAAIELDTIDAIEREETLGEFADLAAANANRGQRAPLGIHLCSRLDHHFAGIELDSPQVVNLRISTKAREMGDLWETTEPGRPKTFQCLREATTDDLATFLQGESPQTIAVVFSHLSAAQAATILTRLSMPVQVEVIRRLTSLDSVSDDVMYAIERGLETWIAQEFERSERRHAGLSAVNDILAATDEPRRRALLTQLEREDHSLREKLNCDIQSSRPTFEDLLRLDANSLERILSEFEPEVVALALYAAEDSSVENALASLDPDDARRVRHDLKQSGPTRLSDVEASGEQIVDFACELELTGEVILSGCLFTS